MFAGQNHGARYIFLGLGLLDIRSRCALHVVGCGQEPEGTFRVSLYPPPARARLYRGVGRQSVLAAF